MKRPLKKDRFFKPTGSRPAGDQAVAAQIANVTQSARRTVLSAAAYGWHNAHKRLRRERILNASDRSAMRKGSVAPRAVRS